MIEKSLVGSKKLNSNILGSSLYKAITIVANLLLVRACVDYMGEEKYGIWLTLLSFFTWFSVLEVGISNSFRNKLTNYFTDQDTINGRIVVTNTYKLIGIVYIALSLFLVCLIILFPLDHFFLPSNFIAQDFTFAFGLSTILFMLYYIAYALNTVLLSTHFAKLTYIISAAQSIVTLLGIYIFMYSGIKPSFIIIFGWFSGIPLLVWTIANIAIYRKTLIAYRPNFSRVFSKKVFPLQKMNGGFFIIQFCILIIFSTDNFIIINKLTGTEVLKYNVAFKYFNILIVVFNLILLPYWSSFTEAAATKNKKWIKHHISKLLLIWVGLAVGAILLFILSASVYELWIGKDLNISNALSIFMGVSILLTAWNSIFAYFLNALSETKVQMTLLLFSAGMNIPLSLYLINEYNTKGVIIATCIALLPLSIALPIQYKTILNKMK